MSAVRRVVTGREKPRADRTHRPHVMPTPRPPRGQPVPQPAMPVSAWAIGALQRAAGNRAVCERLDDSARRARPVQRNYTHAAVSTFGVELAASGEFAGASLDHYNEITKSLRKKVSKSTKERAVRLAMLEEKIRSAWQRLRNTQLAVSDQARTEGTGPPRVLGVFTAPEWFFKRPYQPFDSADKHVITGHIAALSAELPHLLIVPGSILWAEGAGDDLALRNTTVAFLDGRLLRELDKHANLQDTDSYFRSKDPKTRKLPDRDTIDAAYGRGRGLGGPAGPAPAAAARVAPAPSGCESCTFGHRRLPQAASAGPRQPGRVPPPGSAVVSVARLVRRR